MQDDKRQETVTEKEEAVKEKHLTGYQKSQGRFARDPGAASAAGKKGGPAAARVVKRKRLMRDALRDLLDGSAVGVPGLEDAAAALQAAGVSDPTGADAVVYMQMVRAGRGDTEAARFVRDTAGERPADQLNVIPGEIVRPDDVAELSDAELAALADGKAETQALPAPVFPAGVALGVAPAGETIPGTVEP